MRLLWHANPLWKILKHICAVCASPPVCYLLCSYKSQNLWELTRSLSANLTLEERAPSLTPQQLESYSHNAFNFHARCSELPAQCCGPRAQESSSLGPSTWNHRYGPMHNVRTRLWKNKLLWNEMHHVMDLQAMVPSLGDLVITFRLTFASVDRQTARQTDRHTDKQTQTDTQTDRETVAVLCLISDNQKSMK